MTWNKKRVFWIKQSNERVSVQPATNSIIVAVIIITCSCSPVLWYAESYLWIPSRSNFWREARVATKRGLPHDGASIVPVRECKSNICIIIIIIIIINDIWSWPLTLRAILLIFRLRYFQNYRSETDTPWQVPPKSHRNLWLRNKNDDSVPRLFWFREKNALTQKTIIRIRRQWWPMTVTMLITYDDDNIIIIIITEFLLPLL